MSETIFLPPPYPLYKRQLIDRLLREAVQNSRRKIVVLDDDPTGVQTVHHVSVYTDWSLESLRSGFAEAAPLFFVLTNSRAMTALQTTQAHTEIIRNVTAAARECGRDFLIISRGDSTLRGHYPLETELLAEYDGRPADGEIICPFFKEGGRYTLNNIHYVKSGERLIPAAQTEFAQDKTFGFRHSDLREYVEEKTNGAYPAARVQTVSLDSLHALDFDGITAVLQGLHGFARLVVNAADEYDVKVFCIALYRALDSGKRFCYRTAASFVKAVAGIADQPLLAYPDMITQKTGRGGIIMVGSHTRRTTEQLERLLTLPQVEAVELNSDLVLTEGGLEAETRQVIRRCDALIAQGKTPAVFTKRTVLSLPGDTPEAALERSVRISGAVQAVVAGLSVRPEFIVAKGGITSSDIATRSLRVRKAEVLGQISPGVPVWKTGPESRFPEIPYIIFPGNVGQENTLRDMAKTLLNIDRQEEFSMKIGLVYTSTTPELIETVERETRQAVGADAQLISLSDPSIISEIREAGYVTAPPAARLIGLYTQAALQGCDAVLNICSSVGEVADSAQDIARYLGMPIVRIDEEMCREAVRLGGPIAVMATLATTLEPTKNTLRRVAREMGRHITLIDCLVEGAFGLSPEQFKARMSESAAAITPEAKVILFAQGSMAYCEAYIAGQVQKPVLSSPRFGAAALRRALETKGLL